MVCNIINALSLVPPPVDVTLYDIIHEPVIELVGILLLELLAAGLQGLNGLLMLLLTLAQVLLGKLQEALAVDGPAPCKCCICQMKP